ncbi:MAG: hypothetical protein HZA48_02210 [Planctomycetes bacterium]|nr:hypothetical protein [Planctomycetota bacterium]
MSKRIYIDFNNKTHLRIALFIEMLLIMGVGSGIAETVIVYKKTGDTAYLNGLVLFCLIVGLPLIIAIIATIRKIMLAGVITSAKIVIRKTRIRPGDTVPCEIIIIPDKDFLASELKFSVQFSIKYRYLDRNGLDENQLFPRYLWDVSLGQNVQMARKKAFTHIGEFTIPENSLPSGLHQEAFYGREFAGTSNTVQSASVRKELNGIWECKLTIVIPNWPDYVLKEEFEVIPG